MPAETDTATGFKPGDRVRLVKRTNPSDRKALSKFGINEGNLATIEQVLADETAIVRFDSGQRFRLPQNYFALLPPKTEPKE